MRSLAASSGQLAMLYRLAMNLDGLGLRGPEALKRQTVENHAWSLRAGGPAGLGVRGFGAGFASSSIAETLSELPDAIILAVRFCFDLFGDSRAPFFVTDSLVQNQPD